MSKRDEYLAGARAGIPVLLGFIPVGIAYAIMARQAGFDIFETCFMSVAVFAGASQMMAVGMYAQGEQDLPPQAFLHGKKRLSWSRYFVRFSRCLFCIW